MIPFAKRLLKEMSNPYCLNNDPSVSLAADSSLYAREPRGPGVSYFGLAIAQLQEQLPQSATPTAPSGREPRTTPPYFQIKAQRSGFDLDKEEGADGYGAWGDSHKRNGVGFF